MAIVTIIVGVFLAVLVVIVTIAAAVCGVVGLLTGGPGFVACIVAFIEGAGPALLAAAVFLLAAYILFAIFFAVDCAFPAGAPVAGAPGAVGAALTSGNPMDCASAQALLAQAQAALAAATAARDAQQARVDTARNRVTQARAALAAAVAGLAASIWFPFLLPGAIAAFAAASAVLVGRVSQLAAEQTVLAGLEIGVALALADVAAAEALVLALCVPPAAGTPGAPGAGVPGGILVGGNVSAIRT
jgi:hypothetical protein